MIALGRCSIDTVERAKSAMILGGLCVANARFSGDMYYEAKLTIYSSISLSGAEIRIYDLDNSPAGSLGTELFGTESHTAGVGQPSSDTYQVYGLHAGNNIWIQIMLDGYEEYGLSLVFPTKDTQFYATLKADLNI